MGKLTNLALAGLVAGGATVGYFKTRSDKDYVSSPHINADNLNEDLEGVISAYDSTYPDATKILVSVEEHNGKKTEYENPSWLSTTAPHFSNLKGHNILVKSSARWCVPCEAQDPAYHALIERAKGRGIDLEGLTINMDDTTTRNSDGTFSMNIGGYDSVPWYFLMKWDSEKGNWKQEGGAMNLEELPLAVGDYFGLEPAPGTLTVGGHRLELVPGRGHDHSVLLKIMNENPRRIEAYKPLAGGLQDVFYVSFDLDDKGQLAEAIEVINSKPHEYLLNNNLFREILNQRIDKIVIPPSYSVDYSKRGPFEVPSAEEMEKVFGRLGVEKNDIAYYSLMTSWQEHQNN